MTYAGFKGKFCNIAVISVNAPTLSDKDNFLDAKLQRLTTFLPKSDMVIIGEDWNAHAATM